MRGWLKKYNIGFWALSLVLSFMLWLYVMVQNDPETTKVIAVSPVFEGQEALLNDRDIKVTGGLDAVLDIRLRGKRTELSKCTSETVKGTVKLTDITSPGTSRLVCDIKLPVEGVSVEYSAGNYVNVTSDKIVGKPVAVKLVKENIKVPDGYTLVSAELSPTQIKVRAPSLLLGSLDHVKVMPNKEDLDRTTSISLPFVYVDKNGNEISDEGFETETSGIEVTLHISQVKQVNLKVDLVGGGGAQEKNTQVSIDPPSVMLTGDPAVLEPLNTITLGSIDLSKVTSGSKEKFSIEIPNGVESSGQTEAWVTVNLTGLTTQKFDVTNISISNASPPEGYEVKKVTLSLPLMVRGPQASMEQLTVYNIRVVADLTEVELAIGLQNVPVTVYVDGYPDVGAMGEPQISIEVVKTTPPIEGGT